nr:hypothetical protein, secreted [uncultured archaeon]
MLYMTKFLPSIMVLLVFSVLFISLLFAVSPVCGKVHMTSTYYNSEATVTECLMTENADYTGITVLLPHTGYGGLPYSISSGGTGKSIDEAFSEFSHSIFTLMDENYEKIGASLKTESGEYEWKSGIKVSSDLFMGMSIGCEIENGNLEASYSNTNSAIDEDVSAINSMYSSGTDITSRSINYKGVSESQSVDNCGFLSETWVDNIGKTATIESSLKKESPASEEAVDYICTKKIELLPEISSIDESMLIKSKEGWRIVPNVGPASSRPTVIVAGMKFEAYDLTSGEPLFDTQYVPPNGNLLYLHAVENDGPLNINLTLDLSMSSTWSPTP